LFTATNTTKITNMPKINIIKILLDFFEMVFVGTAVFFLIYIFVGQLLIVTGDSMDPTFKDGEQILAEKVSVKVENPKPGQVVVFKHPLNQNRLLIKRVGAVEDDIILISNGKILVNGKTLDEPYLGADIITKGGRYIIDGVSFKVPKNSYVLIGDNREESSDSRDFGPVSKDLIIGKALLVYYPLTHFRVVLR